jgi:hypothetical protein
MNLSIQTIKRARPQLRLVSRTMRYFTVVSNCSFLKIAAMTLSVLNQAHEIIRKFRTLLSTREVELSQYALNLTKHTIKRPMRLTKQAR